MGKEIVLMDQDHGVYTTSLILAEVFNKEHKKVLRYIESLDVYSEEFRQLNFQLSSYLDSKNRKQKAYNITNDGFSILAMKFKGKEAKGLIIKFLDAFNKNNEFLNDRAYKIKLGYKYALENIRVEQGKPIFGTQEWASTNANFINGCSHDCKYCYAKANAVRFKRKTRDNWKQEEVRIDKLSPNIRPKGEYTMFPSSHDISPENHKHALKVLDVLLKKSHRVMIVTKPHLEVVKAICQKFGDYKERILFRFTIGSVDSETLKFWEPNAPSFEERLFSLKYAHSMGFKTSVSSEPALDTNTIELAETVLPYVSDALWLGKSNRLKGIIKLNCGDDKVTQKAAEVLLKSQSDEWVWGLYQHFKENPQIKWKDSMKMILGLHRPSEIGLDM